MTIVGLKPYELSLHERQLFAVMDLLNDAVTSDEPIGIDDLAESIIDELNELLLPHHEEEAAPKPRIRVPAGSSSIAANVDWEAKVIQFPT